MVEGRDIIILARFFTSKSGAKGQVLSPDNDNHQHKRYNINVIQIIYQVNYSRRSESLDIALCYCPTTNYHYVYHINCATKVGGSIQTSTNLN